MEIDRKQITGIAKQALARSGRNRWRAYELAKREVQAQIGDECRPGRYDEAIRRLADALKI